MKTTFENFINEYPKCGKSISADSGARALFNLLSVDENIISMIDTSKAGKPAIAAVVKLIEDHSTNFDISVAQHRSVAGCMISAILAPFGYIPVIPSTKTQKGIPKKLGAKYFKSGSCYFYDPQTLPTMKIASMIVEAKNNR